MRQRHSDSPYSSQAHRRPVQKRVRGLLRRTQAQPRRRLGQDHRGLCLHLTSCPLPLPFPHGLRTSHEGLWPSRGRISPVTHSVELSRRLQESSYRVPLLVRRCRIIDGNGLCQAPNRLTATFKLLEIKATPTTFG